MGAAVEYLEGVASGLATDLLDRSGQDVVGLVDECYVIADLLD